jgi:hypothetical protein
MKRSPEQPAGEKDGRVASVDDGGQEPDREEGGESGSGSDDAAGLAGHGASPGTIVGTITDALVYLADCRHESENTVDFSRIAVGFSEIPATIQETIDNRLTVKEQRLENPTPQELAAKKAEYRRFFEDLAELRMEEASCDDCRRLRVLHETTNNEPVCAVHAHWRRTIAFTGWMGA